ncbi:hypothetical protein XENTR_v10007286 [Xenopus tropicalis]|nr:hypothetical protein XENTR_v10007286 [Xenopus tropicalis]
MAVTFHSSPEDEVSPVRQIAVAFVPTGGPGTGHSYLYFCLQALALNGGTVIGTVSPTPTGSAAGTSPETKWHGERLTSSDSCQPPPPCQLINP